MLREAIIIYLTIGFIFWLHYLTTVRRVSRHDFTYCLFVFVVLWSYVGFDFVLRRYLGRK